MKRASHSVGAARQRDDLANSHDRAQPEAHAAGEGLPRSELHVGRWEGNEAHQAGLRPDRLIAVVKDCHLQGRIALVAGWDGNGSGADVLELDAQIEEAGGAEAA